MFDDPGVVRRSSSNCFPLPPEVEERLRTGQPIDPLRNVVVNGRQFCVRCCVWREETTTPTRFVGVSGTHHCEAACRSRPHRPADAAHDPADAGHTCQRCVRDFDHHCGVFGRCIAGSGMRGNMKYFKLIIASGIAGLFTCVLGLVVQGV